MMLMDDTHGERAVDEFLIALDLAMMLVGWLVFQ